MKGRISAARIVLVIFSCKVLFEFFRDFDVGREPIYGFQFTGQQPLGSLVLGEKDMSGDDRRDKAVHG